ncbi:MAG: hypothetical protein PF904_15840, partial [Kiritimatiellae bacterium]|nr:hypothetical protein [Kiritimatiellia bacterium]
MIRIGIGNAVRVDCGPWATVPPDGRYGLIWINLEGRWPQRLSGDARFSTSLLKSYHVCERFFDPSTPEATPWHGRINRIYRIILV